MKYIPGKLWCELEEIVSKKNTKVGRPKFDNRTALEGILYVLRTGRHIFHAPYR